MHDRQCLVNPPRDTLPRPGALIIANAGNCCQGWSQEGKRARGAHASQHALACWVCQRRELAKQRQEDLFFQECTPHFDLQTLLTEPLADSHLIVSVITGPRLLGWPAARDRLLSAGLNMQTLVWLGPPPGQVQEHFEKLWARRPMLTGAVFLQEGQVRQTGWLLTQMTKKGHYGEVRKLAFQSPPNRRLFRYVLTPGQLQRLEKYKALEKEGAGMDGTYLCDLEHWPMSPGPACGPMFPCLLTHGTILDMNSGKFAMPRDRCLSLGFHASDMPEVTQNERFFWPLGPYVMGQDERVIKQQTGNCQAIPVILAWYLYVFAHTCRREYPQLGEASSPHMPKPKSDESDSDSDSHDAKPDGNDEGPREAVAGCSRAPSSPSSDSVKDTAAGQS